MKDQVTWRLSAGWELGAVRVYIPIATSLHWLFRFADSPLSVDRLAAWGSWNFDQLAAQSILLLLKPVQAQDRAVSQKSQRLLGLFNCLAEGFEMDIYTTIIMYKNLSEILLYLIRSRDWSLSLSEQACMNFFFLVLVFVKVWTDQGSECRPIFIISMTSGIHTGTFSSVLFIFKILAKIS